jgi:hypothetical protein
MENKAPSRSYLADHCQSKNTSFYRLIVVCFIGIYPKITRGLSTPNPDSTRNCYWKRNPTPDSTLILIFRLFPTATVTYRSTDTNTNAALIPNPDLPPTQAETKTLNPQLQIRTRITCILILTVILALPSNLHTSANPNRWWMSLPQSQ